MSYGENLWLFLVLVFGIIAVPGMDMLFVLANALTGGSNRGLAATAGIMLGGAVHTLNGAIGVGLLMHFVPILFTPLLIAGAAYMAYIGMSLMRSSIIVGDNGPTGSRSAWKAFRQGLVTCLINPKAYHPCRLSAIPEAGLRSDLDAGDDHGIADGRHASRDLWRARRHGGAQQADACGQSPRDRSRRAHGRAAAVCRFDIHALGRFEGGVIAALSISLKPRPAG